MVASASLSREDFFSRILLFTDFDKIYATPSIKQQKLNYFVDK